MREIRDAGGLQSRPLNRRTRNGCGRFPSESPSLRGQFPFVSSACSVFSAERLAARTCTTSRSTSAARVGLLRRRAVRAAGRCRATVARGQLHDTRGLLQGGQDNGGRRDGLPSASTPTVPPRGASASTYTARRATDGPAGRRHDRPPRLPPAAVVSQTGARRAAGHLFRRHHDGFGAMPDYAAQIAAGDRWATSLRPRAPVERATPDTADVPAAEPGKIPVMALTNTADVAIPELPAFRSAARRRCGRWSGLGSPASSSIRRSSCSRI